MSFIVCVAHFCEVHGPSTIICTQTSRQQPTLSTSKSNSCASCQLILPNNATSLVSKLPQYTIVSTRYPSCQTRYAAVMKLTMKSLSVETAADPSVPTFFGDMVSGYAINTIFRVKDPHARGGERKYAIMVMSDLESSLLKHWDLVVHHCSLFVDIVHHKVTETTESAPLGPDNERFLRRAMIKPRSLVDLAGDQQLFVKIHSWAAELLQNIIDEQ